MGCSVVEVTDGAVPTGCSVLADGVRIEELEVVELSSSHSVAVAYA